MQKDSTRAKIWSKVVGGATFLTHPVNVQHVRHKKFRLIESLSEITSLFDSSLYLDQTSAHRKAQQ